MKYKNTDEIEGVQWKGFTFTMATIEDLEQVENHLMKYYMRDESLHIALGQLGEESIEYERQIFAALLKQNLSFIAVETSTEKIAGLTLLSHYQVGTSNGLPIEPPSTNLVGKFFNQIEAETNTLEYFGVKQYGEVYIVSVSDDFRGQGLAKEMYRRSLRTFEDLGDSIVVSFVTSPHVQKICASLGFEEFKSWEFGEAKDENGSSLLKKSSLNGRAVLKVLKLNN